MTSRPCGVFFLSWLVFESLFAATAFAPAVRFRLRSWTTQLASKNSDRAYIERNLEDMMDNDWRLFRAKLVAQEQQAKSIGSPSSGASSSDRSGDETTSTNDKFDLFGIFKKKEAAPVNNIFDGDSVAGLPRILDGINIEDPFVSEAELPLLLENYYGGRRFTVDKHRWAHEIPHVEPGCVLVANEKLGGVFHQTIVLVVEHSETQGSTGVVINRPLEGDLLKIATEQATNLDLSLKLAFPTSRVTYGGPVLPDEFSVLHGFGEVDGSRKLCPGVYIGGSHELMNEVRINRFDPNHALFVKGHAGWVPGQLSREISKGVWYTAAVSSDLILRYAGAPITEHDNPHDLWSDILTCMGGKFADIARRNGGSGDRGRMLP